MKTTKTYPSDAQILLEMFKNANLYRTQSDMVLTIERGSRQVNVPLDSLECRTYIKSKFMDDNGYFPNDKSLKDFFDYKFNQAMDYPITEMKHRVLSSRTEIFYDLNDDKGQYIKIAPNGWSLSDGFVERFMQGQDQLPQVIPVEQGDISLLRPFVNLSEEQWPLFVAYLVSCFIPNIQHPIMNVTGANGSGKSTLSRIVKRLVDPSINEMEIFGNGSLDNLVARIASTYYVAFDNLSFLNKRESDFLCMLVTNGSFSKRTLYTNNSLCSIKLDGPISLNGIVDVVSKPDLAQRCLFFEAVGIEETARISEKKFWEDFDHYRPAILGGVFNVLSSAMRLHGSVSLRSRQRLADFHEWGYVICEAAFGTGEAYLKAMEHNEHRQTQAPRDNNSLVQLTIDLVEEDGGFSGTMTVLFKHFRAMLDGDVQRRYAHGQFPKDAGGLGRKLREIESVLKVYGVRLQFSADTKNCSCVEIRKGDARREPITGIRRPIVLSYQR